MADAMRDAMEYIRQGAAAAEAYRLRPPAALTRGPSGIYLGSGSGTSIDFHDFRAYQPGDDLRRVDWGAYARSDALVLRLYREEVSPVVEVAVDGSASMGLYPGKRGTALFLAAFLAAATRRAEGRPVLLLRGQRYVGGAFEAGLERCVFDGQADPPAEEDAPPGPGQSVRFVLSDFLFPVDMDAYLQRAARGAAALTPALILAESELDPPMRGGVRLTNAENRADQRDLRVDGGTVQRYRDRLDAHIAGLEASARKLRSPLLRLVAPDAPRTPDAVRAAVTEQLLRQGVVEAA
ncbi:MAG: DUF58 domain-containing protein [Planctomycetota bacterium]